MADTSRANTVVPTPPRLTGNSDTDVVLLSRFLSDFFQATVVVSGLLDPSYQANAGTFDPDNLPDPTNSSIAKAQDTANRAIEALKAHGLFP